MKKALVAVATILVGISLGSVGSVSAKTKVYSHTKSVKISKKIFKVKKGSLYTLKKHGKKVEFGKKYTVKGQVSATHKMKIRLNKKYLTYYYIVKSGHKGWISQAFVKSVNELKKPTFVTNNPNIFSGQVTAVKNVYGRDKDSGPYTIKQGAQLYSGGQKVSLHQIVNLKKFNQYPLFTLQNSANQVGKVAVRSEFNTVTRKMTLRQKNGQKNEFMRIYMYYGIVEQDKNSLDSKIYYHLTKNSEHWKYMYVSVKDLVSTRK